MKSQPLLPPRSAAAAAGGPPLPPLAGWVYALQASLVLVYLVCAFVLPGQVPFMNEAAHIGTLHAALFVCACLCTMALAPVFTSRVNPFPFTPLLAAAPLLLAVLANAFIVPVLGMESWLRDTMGAAFSVLLIVQMLAVAEALGCAFAVFVVAWRYFLGDTSARSSFEAAAAAAAAARIGGGVAVRRPGYAGGATAALLLHGDDGGGGAGGLYYDDGSGGFFEQIPQYMVAADRADAAELLGLVPGDANAVLPLGAGTADVTIQSAVSGTAGARDGGDTSFFHGSPSPGQGSGVAAGRAPGTPHGPIAADEPPLQSPPLPPPPPQHRLLERLHYLHNRELELTQRLDALTRELVAAAAGTGQTELPLLLRETTEELVALQAAHAGLQERCAEQQEQLLRNEGDLARASTEIARLRQQAREERRKADKLIQNLEIQRGADLAAQQAIRDLQARLAQAQQAAAAAAFAPAGGGGSFSAVSGSVQSNADAMLLARSLGVASSSAAAGGLAARTYSHGGGLGYGRQAAAAETAGGSGGAMQPRAAAGGSSAALPPRAAPSGLAAALAAAAAAPTASPRLGAAVPPAASSPQ